MTMRFYNEQERAKMILFSGYSFKNFITLTDTITGEKCYITIGR